jgi:hypothetical protein
MRAICNGRLSVGTLKPLTTGTSEARIPRNIKAHVEKSVDSRGQT